MGARVFGRTTEVLAEFANNPDLLRNQVEAVLGRLRDRDAHVLSLRYGIDGTRPQTLQEIGDSLDLSRERIRQIERRALRRLRHRSTIRVLRNLYEEPDAHQADGPGGAGPTHQSPERTET